MIRPTVSVLMITYNHGDFIEEAIHGVVTQQTSYTWELIVANDCSTDNTDAIIRKYADKYSQIKYIQQRKNIGPIANFVDAYNNCSGKYIAFCEGDDYWSDTEKLQKQVDFLEKHADYSLCCTEAKVIYHNSTKTHTYTSYESNKDISAADILKNDVIPTASILYRNNLELPADFIKMSTADTVIKYMSALAGKVFFFKDEMTVYRKHPGGIHTTVKGDTRILRQIEFFEFITNNLSYDKSLIKSLLNKSYLHLSYEYAYNGNLIAAKSYLKKINPAYILTFGKSYIKTFLLVNFRSVLIKLNLLKNVKSLIV